MPWRPSFSSSQNKSLKIKLKIHFTASWRCRITKSNFPFYLNFRKLLVESIFDSNQTKSRFAFDHLYIDLKTKTLVVNDQQCFALTLCIQLPLVKPNQNSNVDNFLADLQSPFQIHMVCIKKNNVLPKKKEQKTLIECMIWNWSVT